MSSETLSFCIKDCGHPHGEAYEEWQSFTEYLRANSGQRFMQALKNWSGAKAIWKQVEGDPTDIQDKRLHDTYED